MRSKQLQFELWCECNSQCTFCYLGSTNKHTPDEVKLNSLKNAYNTISDLSNYPEFDTIAYIGGEFFQGQMRNPEVKEHFMKLMAKTAQLLRDGYVKEMWMYVTLTIGNQKDLYEALELFKGVTNKVWILTSYDTLGRFHTPKMEENWDFHMQKMYNLYPDLRFNITTILSSDCIKKYLADQISFKDMAEKYHAMFFFKQVGCDNEPPSKFNETHNMDFVPTRTLFLEFLRKFKRQESSIMWDKICNVQYRADVLYRNGNDLDHQMIKNIRHKDHRGAEIELEYESPLETSVAPCGHLYTYHAYSDCDGCVLCDKEMLSDE